MYCYISLILVVVGLAFLPLPVLAHCPLCTAGAGIVALGAYWLGVEAITIGVALGAFATAMGLWFGRLIKRQFIPRQQLVIAALSWILTLFPLRKLFADYASWYVDWSGEYGSLFNRTYAVNLFLVGAIVGTVIIVISPAISRKITNWRGGRQWPFQGIILTFLLIIVVAAIIQLL